jgi:peptidoglycan/LPS O-acetylase OafA/YrhL
LNKLLKGLFAEIETVPPVLQSSYYPSLDGLRGVAIIMVVLAHLHFTSRFYYDVIFNGKLGVLIFFVLSGFLITTLCIKEKVITKNISLKNFYLRRALRIFPVAYLFIFVLILLNYFFNLNISYINILGAAFYLMNFSFYFRKHHFSWHTAHFWSLAVEEQFYLIIPFILKKKFKVYLLTLLTIIFILPVFIYLQYLYPPLNNTVLYAFTHYLIKFQAIAVGCLFSVLTFKYAVNATIFAKTKIFGNILAIFLVLFIQYDDFFSLQSVFSCLAISILTGYIIITNIALAKDFIFKLLNAKILKIVGVLSYSIYIWQQIFTSNDHKLPGFIVTYPFNIISLIIVSCLSYYFYERFFLKLKTRFSKIKISKPVVAA